MTKQEIYDMMVECSGPHKEFKDNTNKVRDGKDLYSTFHWPDFHFTNSLRNTQIRFKEFGITDLTNKSVLDLGSNIGGISFEALRLNATKVIGHEYVKERVKVCEELAKFLNLKNAHFQQNDLNVILNDMNLTKNFTDIYKSDVVFCTAVDAYIGSKYKLYKMLADLTKEVCYFETNTNQNPSTLASLFYELGFTQVDCLGVSKSDSGFGRCSFVLRKPVEIIRIRDLKCEEYSHQNFETNSHFISKYKYPHIYNKMKHLLIALYNSPHMIPIEFEDNLIIKTPRWGKSLFDLKDKITLEDKKKIKNHIIQFMKTLQYVGLAHMDIHVKNVLYNGTQIKVIDWEFVELCDSSMEKHYDLTGKGIDNGFPSSLGQHILRKNDSFSILEFLKPVTLEMKDFLE